MSDVECYKIIFEHIRSGQFQEIQEKLIEANLIDKFLWLIGSLPHFDNIEFTQRTDCNGDSDLVPNDTDRENNLDKLRTSAECGINYAGGNRCNLLFIETCLENIHQNENF